MKTQEIVENIKKLLKAKDVELSDYITGTIDEHETRVQFLEKQLEIQRDEIAQLKASLTPNEG